VCNVFSRLELRFYYPQNELLPIQKKKKKKKGWGANVSLGEFNSREAWSLVLWEDCPVKPSSFSL
jgi:hypothetical protein